MARKQLNIRILVSALVISAILFSAGFYTGYSINKQILGSIENDLKKVTADIQNFQLQFLFFDVLGESATCPLLRDTLSNINTQSYEIGNRLVSSGSEGQITDQNEYIILKKEYSRLLTGYWLLAKKLKDTCGLEASTIIYFFSKECTTCDDQGFVLSYLKNRMQEKLLVFALDGNLEEPSVKVLKEYFNIKTYPSLIINGKLYGGFYSVEDIEKLLKTAV